jgi:hypothetical protein
MHTSTPEPDDPVTYQDVIGPLRTTYDRDDQIAQATRQYFDTVDFRRVTVEGEVDGYFQALTLRRPPL